ncbi:hypothetical protein VTK56DRAFT_2292 [Thermocarpiscus australiensis]
MEGNSTAGDFYRPPPTAPKGRPKKKARWEGPPRRRDDWQSSRSPQTQLPSFQDHESSTYPRSSTERTDSPQAPPRLGNYVAQHGPPGPSELKIRGQSLAPAKLEGCRDDGGKGPFPDPEVVFRSGVADILLQVQLLEPVIASSGYPQSHPVSQATRKIRGQLNRL